MPLYEYVCQECLVKFEQLRAFSACDEATACDTCGSFNTNRALSIFNAHGGQSKSSGSTGSCSGCSGGNCSSCH